MEKIGDIFETSESCSGSFCCKMVTEDRCQSQDVLELRSRKVCRSLWGPVDHDQIAKDLEREQKKITKEMSHKWNYDFEADKPLEGRWAWCEEKKVGRSQKRPKSGPTPQAKRRRAEQQNGTSDHSTNCSSNEKVSAGTSKIVSRQDSKRKPTRKTRKSSLTKKKGAGRADKKLKL